MVEEIRVVMFGKTGVGKSLLGSNILDKNKYFPSRGAAKSVTKEAKRGERMIDKDHKLAVVDTPGLFDTDTDDNMKTAKILTSIVRETKPGPHVFIFVLSIIHRYTPEEKAAIEFLKDLLGSHVTDYLIIVFTGKDTIDYDKIDLKTYIDEADDDLKKLVNQCRGSVAIHNRASDKEVAHTVDDILQLIKDVYRQNKKKYYTDELLTEAEKTFVEKLRLQEEEAHKRERELERANKKLEEDKYNNINTIEALRKDQEETRKKYEDEIREKERLHLQTVKTFERVSKIGEANGKLKKKIKDLSQELEDIRTKYTELLKVNMTQEAKYQQLLQTISENSTKISDLENEKEVAREEYKEMFRLREEQAEKIYKDKVQRLTEMIDDLVNINLKNEEELRNMRKKLDELKNERTCTII